MSPSAVMVKGNLLLEMQLVVYAELQKLEITFRFHKEIKFTKFWGTSGQKKTFSAVTTTKSHINDQKQVKFHSEWNNGLIKTFKLFHSV